MILYLDNMSDLKYLAFLHYLGINQKKFFTIFDKNRDYKCFFENISFTSLKDFFKEKDIEKILDNYKKIKIDKIEEKLKKRDVKIITFYNEDYPKVLKEISNPPYFLYVRWTIDNSPKLAIIWSRGMTSYWEKAIKKLVPDLSRYFTIVSWWAFWCDSEAHSETLNNNWNTISVIWTWIDIDYPKENKKIFDKIANSWAVISIFPVWEIWNPYNFPIRNEIISWISSGVVVIEAKEKSWTHITALLALEQWKDLFAVPWDIFKWNSIWCNNLIRDWNAKIVSESLDILEEYNITLNNRNNKKSELNFSNDDEKVIFNTLLLESFSIDELVEKLEINLLQISISLSMLEIKGLIKKNISWKYEII